MSWSDEYYKEQEELLRKKRQIEEDMNDREIGYSGYIQASKDLEKVKAKLSPENRDK